MKDREESALVQAKRQLQQFWQDTGVTCDERLLKAFCQLSREEFVSRFTGKTPTWTTRCRLVPTRPSPNLLP